MQLAKTARIYQREYEKEHSRRFWINPAVGRKLFDLDRNLEKLKIDPEEYVMYCMRKWRRLAEHKSIPEKIIPIKALCNLKSIEGYIAADPITERTYLYSVFLEIEETVAIGTVRAYLEMREKGETDITPYMVSIDSWRENEFGVCYEGKSTFSEAVQNYQKLYDKAVEHSAINACSKYGVRFEFADYDYIAKQVLDKRRRNGN